MAAQFTDDEVGKRVVNENGDEIGIVSSVEHGTAHVEPDPGITDTFRAKLGWEDQSEDTYPLQENAVESITDDEIRLRSDLEGSTSSGGMGTETTSGTGTGSGTDSDVMDTDSDLMDTDSDVMNTDDESDHGP